MKITAKQASLMGLPAPRLIRDHKVSRLIIKMRDGSQMVSAQQVTGFVRSAGVSAKSAKIISGDVTMLTLDTPVSIAEANAMAARLAGDSSVEYAEPDFVLRPFLVPNDPEFTTKQWNLLEPSATYSGALAVTPAVPPRTAPAAGAINMPTAWDITTGSASVVIAIIDTGITNHPDLNGEPTTTPQYMPGTGGRFLQGYDFISLDTIQGGAAASFRAGDGNGRENNPTDDGDATSAADKTNFPDDCDDNERDVNGNPTNSPDSLHGTLTAGVAAASSNNNSLIAGVAWAAKILPVRAIGRCGGSMTDMADAIRWSAGLPVTGVTDNPTANIAKIIYVGAGTVPVPGVACGPTLQNAIDAAIAAGSVVIAPTGNHGELNLSSPA
ncbi:MAG: S8 family serine peptidase, partial [Burkholderiaceae bacterium]